MKKLLFLTSLLVLMFGLAACGGGNTANEPQGTAPANAQQLNIVAKNYEFDKKEYHVKKGQPVYVTLALAQGIHGLEIEGTPVKLQGSKLAQTFTPDKAGSYEIHCTIPCGPGHLTMKSTLIVE